MIFEWDEVKNLANQKKHGVDFEIATTIFNDPFHLILPNDFDNEQRFEAIGRVQNGDRILLVIHTYLGENDEVIRIISARKLAKGEVFKYGYR